MLRWQPGATLLSAFDIKIGRLSASVRKQTLTESDIARACQKADDAISDAPRDKCALSCAINGIHAAFHYLKKNYISGSVMTVPTG
nr:hypothetical protein [Escherichia coli]